MQDTARQFLRALRGSRSQVAFSRRLGYRSNVCTDWEAGRRFPRASEVFRIMGRAGLDVPAGLGRFHAPSAAAFDEGFGAWLGALLGDTTLAAAAARTGVSRHQLGRWIRGDAEPRLPDLLRVLDGLTGRMPDWVGAFVDPAAVPSVMARAAALSRAERLVFDTPWSPAVLTWVATAGPAGTRPEALASALGLSPDALAGTLDALLDAGLLTRVDGRLALRAPLTSSARGSPDDRRAVREHWSRVALARTGAPGPGDLTGFNVFAVSRDDLERIRERYRAFYRDVRSIVAASEPPETAALLLVHLIDWGGAASAGGPGPDVRR